MKTRRMACHAPPLRIRGMRWLLAVCGLVSFLALAWLEAPAGAQDPFSESPYQPGFSPEQVIESPVAPQAVQGAQAAADPAAVEGAPTTGSEQTPGAKATKGADKDSEKKDKEGDANGHVKRGDTPPVAADRSEFDVKPDANGLFSFRFRGQKWPDVIDWYSENAGVAIDWLELPGDYLNVETPRAYTKDETRDLLNRHLLARGFTLVEHPGGLSVVEVANLNPAAVPRVRAGDLHRRQPYDFVKVSFKLHSAFVEDIVSELDSIKSPNGKLVAMRTTNRIEAMDAVVNLRDMYEIISEEELYDDTQETVEEFKLLHTKAEDVRSYLLQLLGQRDNSARRGGGGGGNVNPQMAMMLQQQMQQMQQQMMQAMQNASNANAAKGGAAKRSLPEVRIIANARLNSLIVHAHPRQLRLITTFIETLDVPSDRGSSLEAQLARVQVHRLLTINAQELALSLEEMGALQPTTTIKIDATNNALIVDGDLVDQMTIRKLIDKLDGSARRFEVITLRQLAADQVAGSIEFLMGGSDDKEQDSQSSYELMMFGYYPYSNRSSSKKKTDQFRVAANVQYNQVLLWCNELEFEQVKDLLVKLGEIVDPEQLQQLSRVRTVEAADSEETREFLRALQRRWPSISPNQLIMPKLPPPAEVPVPSGQGGEDSPSSEERPIDKGGVEETRTRRPLPPNVASSNLARLPLKTQFVLSPQQNAEEQNAEATSGETFSAESPSTARPPQTADSAPPVHLSIGPDGELVIRSDDPVALNILEEILRREAPKAKDFEVFQLEHAPAFWVRFNLVDYFKEEDEQSQGPDWMFPPLPRAKEQKQLGKRNKIKFIDDYDTNTIVVRHATPGQLETVRRLIQLYDVPEPKDESKTRETKLFAIRYHRASAIADTIKGTFPDLLNSEDRAAQYRGRQGNQNQNRNNSDDDTPPPRALGSSSKLAIGVDSIANVLIVTTEGKELMLVIEALIAQLDRAAMPAGRVNVVELKGLTPRVVEGALRGIFQNQANQPQQPQQGNPGQPPNGQQPFAQPPQGIPYFQPGNQPAVDVESLELQVPR